MRKTKICGYSLFPHSFTVSLYCGVHSVHGISTDLCKSAYQWCRQPAYSQQWKGSISSPMASRHSHLIHPMGEKSIQVLKLAAGRYPFWRACVCLFSKEQNRIERGKRERERNCCLLCYPMRNHSNWATGHWGRLLCVCASTDGIVTNLQFRLIPHTDSK